jgi:uncharacterized protein (DUF302 family)
LPLTVDIFRTEKMAAEGLTIIASDFGPEQTMSRLEAEIQARGMTLFARIDHAAGAKSVGLPLRPTTLLIFGSAKGGTPLMEAEQVIGIDLPLRVLIYQDADGNTRLAYYSPSWLAQRHNLPAQLTPNISALTTTLETLVAVVARAR